MRRSIRSSSAGLSAIEMVLMIGLIGVIAVKSSIVMTDVAEVSSSASTDIVLQDQAYKVLNMIALAVQGSDRETLVPDASSPLHSTNLRFSVVLGEDEGEVIWSDPELIGTDADPSQLVWRKKLGLPDEVRVVWTNLLSPFLEGEIENGIDDNGNGLVDERGVSFELDRNAVIIRLTMRKVVNGEPTLHTVETTVTCRNLVRG